MKMAARLGEFTDTGKRVVQLEFATDTPGLVTIVFLTPADARAMGNALIAAAHDAEATVVLADAGPLPPPPHLGS